MKRHFNPGYALKEGFKSIFTHGTMSFASVCMIIACLVIMGSFTLVALNLNNMLKDLEDQNEFIAYVDESYTTEQAQALQSEIEAVDNVSEVKFVTREEALQAFQEQSGNDELLQDLPSTVLRDRYEIHVDDISRMQETVDAVSQIEGIAGYSAQMRVAEGFVTVRNIASIVALILVAVLVVISLFIISNTVRLATFHRKEEIAIIKMCGATNAFVRWPFIIEGMVLGLIGAFAAFFIEWGLYILVQNSVSASDTLSLITILPFQNFAPYIAGIFVAAGLIIGIGGSSVAIRRFLQV